MRNLIALLAVAGSAVTLAVAPATASQPEPIAIQTYGHFTGPNSVAGVWTLTDASGAVVDSGTYTETFRFAAETLHVEKVLVGSRGTLVLHAEGIAVITGTIATFKAGNWHIADGTGAYEGLHAGGTPATGPGSFADLATGVVHVSHVGQAHDE